MTAAASILCAFWCAASASQGARLVEPERARLGLDGGLNANLPTLGLAATAGVTRGFDLALRYDTHAGIAHDVGLDARLRLADRWALALDVTNSFFAVEEVAGIRAVDAPFGNGVSSTPRIVASHFTAGATHLWAGGGLSLRWLAVVDELGTARRQLGLSVRYLRALVGAEWETGDGSTYLRFVANIPIEAEARVVGFFPWVVLGRTWGLP